MTTPSGFNSVTPYLIVDGAGEAIEFYQRVFGARELMRMASPDGKVSHAELQIGDSRVMLADAVPKMGFLDPKAIGGTPVSLHVYLDDVDTTFGQAIDAGAEAMRPVEDQFYGDRMGVFRDPFGHVWSVATHKEDISSEELQRRFDSLSAQGD